MLEEEIFGDLVLSDTTGTWWAILSPSSGLPAGADSVVPINFIDDTASGGHYNAGADYGWWDVDAGDGPCISNPIGTGLHRKQGAGFWEDEIGDYGPGQELHCVETGTEFTLDLVSVDDQDDTTIVLRREIDYRRYRSLGGIDYLGYYDNTAGNSYEDAWVWYDDVNDSDGPATPDIEVSIVLDPNDTDWAPIDTSSVNGKWNVPKNYTIRLGAWESDPPGGSPYNTMSGTCWSGTSGTTQPLVRIERPS